jgi:predicted 3-demethylubiquinone-9 3-methyltransferase (glyoxalase superfamily)
MSESKQTGTNTKSQIPSGRIQTITPHLWFDKEAVEAAKFYASIFPNSRVTNVTTIRDTPSGDCDVVSFELSGQPFMAISAGPLFKFNESISFIVKCDTQEQIDYYWGKRASCPRFQKPNSVAGSKTNTACRGR